MHGKKKANSCKYLHSFEHDIEPSCKNRCFIENVFDKQRCNSPRRQFVDDLAMKSVHWYSVVDVHRWHDVLVHENMSVVDELLENWLCRMFVYLNSYRPLKKREEITIWNCKEMKNLFSSIIPFDWINVFVIITFLPTNIFPLLPVILGFFFFFLYINPQCFSFFLKNSIGKCRRRRQRRRQREKKSLQGHIHAIQSQTTASVWMQFWQI